MASHPPTARRASASRERNIRYYRARGLLDAPGSETGEKRRGFSEKHACQLRAIRLLQARALPLEQIQETLRDRTFEQLQEIEREELRKLNGAGASIAGGAAQENWSITAVGGRIFSGVAAWTFDQRRAAPAGGGGVGCAAAGIEERMKDEG